jgi:hypothetical protein
MSMDHVYSVESVAPRHSTLASLWRQNPFVAAEFLAAPAGWSRSGPLAQAIAAARHARVASMCARRASEFVSR